MKLVGFFFFVLVFSASAVSAQSNDEGLAFLQLNFFNPGARSLAMGGAFVGMADDATAALANPAGMTVLIRPEFSVEFSATNYKNEIPWTSGSQSFDVETDILGNIITREFNFQNNFGAADFSNTVSNLSFASFVYPAIKNKFVISGFYNEQTKFERTFLTTGYDRIVRSVNGVDCNGDCGLGPDDILNSFFATDTTLQFKIRNFGASLAVGLGSYVNLGVTLTSSKLEVDNSTLRLNTDNSSNNRESLTGDDRQFSYSLGALLKPSEKFSFGFVYTHRPEFDVTSSTATFNLDGSVFKEVTTNPTFRIPDNYAFGVSVRPSDRFALNFDVNQIMYSQLNDGYYNAFFFGTDTASPLNNKTDFNKNDLEVEDGTEVRFGGEYAVSLGSHPFFIRAGYWHEPFHSNISTAEDSAQQLLFDANGLPANEVTADPFFSRSLKKDYHHVSFGTGIGLGQVTIDWAYDYSKNFKRFILSTNFHL